MAGLSGGAKTYYILGTVADFVKENNDVKKGRKALPVPPSSANSRVSIALTAPESSVLDGDLSARPPERRR